MMWWNLLFSVCNANFIDFDLNHALKLLKIGSQAYPRAMQKLGTPTRDYFCLGGKWMT